MSTKNLARTVIEGGRSYYNSWERRHSHAEARAAVHAVETRARSGDDADALVWPEPKHVGKSFHDKLSAAEQWLRAHVGRPWSKVRSEIASRFDTRTLAGRHIVFDHLLPSRWELDGTWRVSRDTRFFVDRHGILRLFDRPRASRRLRAREWREQAERSRALAFAIDRRVAVRGSQRYWLEPVMRDLDGPRRYRQDRSLDEDERAFFDALGEHGRACITRSLP